MEDAEIICNFRNDKQLNKYLSSSGKTGIDEQKSWIQANFNKKDGYYFKIIDLQKNECCGTISIYNVTNKQAEFGRYICTKSLQAVESEYILLKYGFDIMKLERIYCRTAAENIKVWRQHYKFGFSDVGEEFFPVKELMLKIQELTCNTYKKTDYSLIEKLVVKFH